MPEITDYELRRELLRAGKTSGVYALDADVILAAQAATLEAGDWGMRGAEVLIATSNVGHLSRFAVAQEWQDIG